MSLHMHIKLRRYQFNLFSLDILIQIPQICQKLFPTKFYTKMIGLLPLY